MLKRLTSREIAEWRAFFRYREEIRDEARQETSSGTDKAPSGSPHERALAERDEARRQLLAGEIDKMPTGIPEEGEQSREVANFLSGTKSLPSEADL